MGALIAIASVVCLAIAFLTAIGHGASNTLAWFIAGVLLFIVSVLFASWEHYRPRVPRA